MSNYEGLSSSEGFRWIGKGRIWTTNTLNVKFNSKRSKLGYDTCDFYLILIFKIQNSAFKKVVNMKGMDIIYTQVEIQFP